MFSDDVFVMDSIIGYRKFHGVNQYQVKWRDWPLTAATWEPWNNILDPSADILLQMAACKCKWELAHKSVGTYPHHSEDTILSTLDMGRLKVLENVLSSCVFVEPDHAETSRSSPSRKRRKIALYSTAIQPQPSSSTPETTTPHESCESDEETTDLSAGDDENIWDYQSPRRRVTPPNDSEASQASDDDADDKVLTPPVDETSETQKPPQDESDLSIADSLLASSPMTTAEDLRLSFLKSRIKTALTNLGNDLRKSEEPSGPEPYFGIDDGHTISTADSSKRARSVSPPMSENIVGTQDSAIGTPSSATTSTLLMLPCPGDRSPSCSPPSSALDSRRSSVEEDRFAQPQSDVENTTASSKCRIIKFTNLDDKLHVIYEVDGEVYCATHEEMQTQYAQELRAYWLSTQESAT